MSDLLDSLQGALGSTYRIERELGGGGMSRVFVATETALGRRVVIKLLSPESIVTIEGHTDASGSAAYNLELSRVRARAVRDYLVQRHGIDAARLKTVGYGKDRPIEDSDPHAAINRRVQFRGS